MGQVDVARGGMAGRLRVRKGRGGWMLQVEGWLQRDRLAEGVLQTSISRQGVRLGWCCGHPDRASGAGAALK